MKIPIFKKPILLAFFSTFLIFFSFFGIGYFFMHKDHEENGIEKGILVSYEFKPEETNIHPSISMTDEIKPASYTAVVSNGDREEVWISYDVSKQMRLGDSIDVREGWEWIFTNK